MEKLYVFGTGNAQAVHCYNTCFALKDEDEFFMVDAGGGNGILKILEEMNVDLSHIHHIFVTHEHTDHILGIVWMIRMIAAAMKKDAYRGQLQIYCHPDLTETISTLCRLTLQGKFYNMIGERIFLVPVEDGEKAFLAHHANVIVAIVPGELRYEDADGNKVVAAVSSGFVEMINNRAKLFCLSVERPEEIDIRRAQEAKEHAEEQLRQKQSIQEYHMNQLALARAMTRLRVTKNL